MKQQRYYCSLKCCKAPGISILNEPLGCETTRFPFSSLNLVNQWIWLERIDLTWYNCSPELLVNQIPQQSFISTLEHNRPSSHLTWISDLSVTRVISCTLDTEIFCPHFNYTAIIMLMFTIRTRHIVACLRFIETSVWYVMHSPNRRFFFFVKCIET